MNDLGNRISELLREYGIAEPIARINGGPDHLVVETHALDREGRKFVGIDGESVATNTYLIDLR